MRNKNNALILTLLGGLSISATGADQPDALKGVKSAVSMQQTAPQQTPPPQSVASTDTSAGQRAPTTALPPAPPAPAPLLSV